MNVDISPKRPPMSSWTAAAPAGSGSVGGGSSTPSRSMRRITAGLLIVMCRRSPRRPRRALTDPGGASAGGRPCAGRTAACAPTTGRCVPNARPGQRTVMTSDVTKPLAVVTGASSGIGFELARQFAENGFDLLIVAEDAELTTAADELRELGARVEALQLDLAGDGAVDELYARIPADGRPVAALALNAGIGA